MRAFLAAVFMICAVGQTLAASDADQSTIRGIIQDQIEAFQRDDGARIFICEPYPSEHVRIARALYGHGQ